LDATLLQKQDPVPHLRAYPYVFVFPLLAFHAPVLSSANSEITGAIPWHAGRDVLLEAHVLVI
jgi:hypothetical protein